MSRWVRRVASILAMIAAPLAAQDPPPEPVSAEAALADADAAFGPPPPRPRCGPQTGGEIVVCGVDPDQEQFRVRSDRDAEDDYARATMDKNAPRAPDVAGPGIFRGPATVGSLCIPGLQKCPPPPAIVVDFAALPEAPPGSDADRIARGLPPLGNDDGPPANDIDTEPGVPVPD
jgi:hypothetical protein